MASEWFADPYNAGGGEMPWVGAAIAGGASLIGTAMSTSGAASANAANRQMSEDMQYNANVFSAQQAQYNRDWQEKMYDTRYERQVNDLKTAGLNPMLAYGQSPGGAPSGAAPSGATAGIVPMQNKYAALANSGSAVAQVQESLARAELTKGQTDLLATEKKLKEAQILREGASAGRDVAETERVRQEMTGWQYRVKTLESQMGISMSEALEKVRRTEYLSTASPNYQPGKWGGGGDDRFTEKFAAELRALVSEADKLKEEAVIRKAEVPKALNEAAAESSWFKRSVSPYLPDFLKGATGLRMMR